MAAQRTTIGALAKTTGIKIETIRYYERIGLIPSPPRSEGGQRIYEEDDRKRLSFVKRCRELGFSLDDVRTLLDLRQNDNRTCREVKEKTTTHLRTVRTKIADLKRMERALNTLAQSCEGGDDTHCPILEQLFA
ncbi:MerR family transcriptional regulator [Iodidimonas muriae]|uniref:MerR family transcriptional regulator n=1 Tax=Iodidimonas muriae TaxID=261467 RepID=A0ABQ2LGN4_9PROT|nr:helix-turn-helix domain-containing protein [Iodidimonas muriae]GER08426.1 MerR family transcriptional regulator [Kordiimonadales bacterium JCM 17843]GGO16967.1 MerR family transcriptional regulator [Iodidimonas muriae]